MELKVYNWEYHERGKTRYIIFACVILTVVVLSILINNIIGWVIVLLFFGWYLYVLRKTNEPTTIIIWERALQIWRTPFPRNKLSWFVLEYHTKKEKIHNIVIIDDKKDAKIFTINDSNKNIEIFVNELNEHIPLLEKYEQSSLDKFIRRIKL